MRIARTMVLLVLLAAGCGKKQETGQSGAVDSAGAMNGMHMAMQGMQMMPLMVAHLDSLGGMEPARMVAAMAAHQDLASRMMDAMGADMRGMNMQPDSSWAALGDSLRQDLAELPGLSGSALQSRMQAHIGRMRRMMAAHKGMMRM